VNEEKKQENVVPEVNSNNSSLNQIPLEYKPISMWGYFGYEILFSLPCIGIILLLVFSFGGTQNKNLKNFARSYFCFLIIAVILVAILVTMFGIGATTYGSSYNY
jgi:phosphoglycerol transferase MdoB-like AlkP superfamily enzyme